MEALRPRAVVVLCVLVLCGIVGLSEVTAQTNSSNVTPDISTTAKLPIVYSGNSTVEIGAASMTTTTTTKSTETLLDLSVGNTGAGWKPVPERELLGQSQLFVFYQLTMGFLHMIQPHPITDLEKLFDFDDWAKTGDNFKEHAQEVIMYVLGFAICLLIGVFLLLIVPLTGCCVGLCRCCGRCGGDGKKPRDGPSSECGRCCFGFVLFALLAFVLTGGVLMVHFSTEIRARLTGEQSAFDDISDSFHRLAGYTETTLVSMNKSTLVRFTDTSKEVLTEINQIIPEIQDEINVTQHLDAFQAIADNLPLVKLNAQNVNAMSINYTKQRTDLNGKLIVTKTDVSDTLNNCTDVSCKKAQAAITNLTLAADFTGVQLDAFIMAVSKVLSQNISEIANVAKEQFNSAFESANDTLQTELIKAKDESKKIEDGIRHFLMNIRQNFGPEIFESISVEIKGAKEIFYSEVHLNLFSTLLTLAIIVLVVVLFYYIGLCYGFSGHRPSRNNSKCCTWKTGACWLLVGVVFTYLFYLLLMFVLVIIFLAGGLVYTEACQYAYNLPNSEAKGFFDRLTQSFIPNDITFTLSKTYLDCANNQSAYTAFQLRSNGVDLDKIMDLDAINKTIDKIKDIHVDIGPISFFPEHIKTSLLELATAMDKVSNQTSDWITEQRRGVMDGDLGEVASLLSAAANESGDPALINSAAQSLREYESNQLPALELNLETLSMDLGKLKAYAGQNLTAIVYALTQAEARVNNSASDIVKEVINKTADSTKEVLGTSASLMKTDLQTNIGRCHPVYEAVSTMVNSVCVQTLYPLNAYAFAMGMALVFLLPSILCAFKLVKLYRKTKSYATIEDDDRDLYMAYQDGLYAGAKDSQNAMLLHRVDRPASDYIAMADNPVYTIDDEMSPVPIPRAVIRTGTRVLPSLPAAPDDRYFYAMPSHGYPGGEKPHYGEKRRTESGPPPRYTANPDYAGV